MQLTFLIIRVYPLRMTNGEFSRNRILFRIETIGFCLPKILRREGNDVMEAEKVMMRGFLPFPSHQESLDYLRVCLVVATKLCISEFQACPSGDLQGYPHSYCPGVGFLPICPISSLEPLGLLHLRTPPPEATLAPTLNTVKYLMSARGAL